MKIAPAPAPAPVPVVVVPTPAPAPASAREGKESWTVQQVRALPRSPAGVVADACGSRLQVASWLGDDLGLQNVAELLESLEIGGPELLVRVCV